MASYSKAQVPLICHFCDEQTIHWKCEECDVFMCTSCKEKKHQRLKSVQNHTVVSFSEIWKAKRAPSREVESEVISSVLKSYTTSVPSINSVLCFANDLYFIYHLKEKEARLVQGKMLTSSISIFQTLEKQIFDIAVNEEGDILFDEVCQNDVYILTHLGEIKTVLNSSPMKPLAIHVNKNNESIVGFREQKPVFPVTDFSVRQVIIFDSAYKPRVVLETDTKGNKLFSYPARIKTDSKNVLYVADLMKKDHSGRIVAVDTNGCLQFTYNGNPNSKTFFPYGIAITPSDNIILSDGKNNALHVLNTKGELLGLHFVDKIHNIQNPNSLCIDSEGFLLIGRGFLKGSDANIYKTKIVANFK